MQFFPCKNKQNKRKIKEKKNEKEELIYSWDWTIVVEKKQVEEFEGCELWRNWKSWYINSEWKVSLEETKETHRKSEGNI